MSTASLRPILRPSALPSLPSTSTSATYICQSCRHARLLRRPKRPYSFTQLVTLSDGSAFMTRTTSPVPVYRSTRDTRNAPLWNPNNRDLQNVEEDEAGRLAGFRARFGSTFDVQREAQPAAAATNVEDTSKGAKKLKISDIQQGPFFRDVKETKFNQDASVEEQDYYEFEEDDANLIDLISSYGQDIPVSKKPPPFVPKKGKK